MPKEMLPFRQCRETQSGVHYRPPQAGYQTTDTPVTQPIKFVPPKKPHHVKDLFRKTRYSAELDHCDSNLSSINTTDRTISQ